MMCMSENWMSKEFAPDAAKEKQITDIKPAVYAGRR